MANYKILIPFIQKWEGGFSNHPADKGGATNKGVTLATFQNYRKSLNMPVPTVDDLKKISDEDWGAIFKKLYWDKFRADEIKSQFIANLCVDWAWGSGVAGAAKQIQKNLGLTPDGIVGNQTLTRLNSGDWNETATRIYLAHENFYISICKSNPSQQVFLKGWMNRLNDLFKNYR